MIMMIVMITMLIMLVIILWLWHICTGRMWRLDTGFLWGGNRTWCSRFHPRCCISEGDYSSSYSDEMSIHGNRTIANYKVAIGRGAVVFQSSIHIMMGLSCLCLSVVDSFIFWLDEVTYLNSQVGFVIMAVAMFMMGCEMDATAVNLSMLRLGPICFAPPPCQKSASRVEPYHPFQVWRWSSSPFKVIAYLRRPLAPALGMICQYVVSNSKLYKYHNTKLMIEKQY